MDTEREYFEWMCNLVCGRKRQNYRRLLEFLHTIEFTYIIPLDSNRAEDGIDLRYRFIYQEGYSKHSLDGFNPFCSVLEMMIGLAIRCEEHIADNPDIGDRTGKWFWDMIDNLGLGKMTDLRFDERRVQEAIDMFLNREYLPDGTGGLFTVKNCECDLREIEIWYQMCWHLNDIL